MMMRNDRPGKHSEPRRAPMEPGAGLRLMRLAIAILEWALRLLVLNRGLPRVSNHLRDLAYGEHEKHRLDIIIPEGHAPFPLLIYVHGGAWVTGDKSNFAWVARSFAHSGLVVFNANYRWAPEASFCDQIQDVAQAVAWALEHAGDYGGDPDAVFLAGDSAGAHLICWLHMALSQPALLRAVGLKRPVSPQALRGSLLFYGLYDLDAAWGLGAAVRTPIRCLLSAEPAVVPALTALASPLKHIAPGVAPVFVCCGERDTLWRQSTSLLEALQCHGVVHRRLLLSREHYPDAGHSFLNFGHRASTKLAMREALAFIGELRANPGLQVRQERDEASTQLQ